MTPLSLNVPSIPIAYGLLILEAAEAKGATREMLLRDASIPPALWTQSDARLSLAQGGSLLFRALQHCADGSLGYEIGLRSKLTSHGFLGYGLISHTTLRQAIEFGSKFLQLRLPNLNLELRCEPPQAILTVTEKFALGPIRRCMFDLFLVGLWRMVPALSTQQSPQPESIELWFDAPEPPCFAQYRDRLPPVRFSMPANQLRFPAVLLDQKLSGANPVTVQLVADQCEKELSQLGVSSDLLVRIRALLVAGRQGYPDQETLATRLNLSTRTLKRKLQQHGQQYQGLLDEARKRDATRLLQDTTLSIEDIAAKIGYTDRANFTRAFRRWTAQSPNQYRQSRQRPAAE